jgi:hypothetical protein
MKIEVLFVSNCPNHAVAVKRLQEVLLAESVRAPVNQVLVKDVEMARSLEFPGSPTIRVDGCDAEPQDEKPAFGLMCRLYSNGTGTPSYETLRAAIRKARGGEI